MALADLINHAEFLEVAGHWRRAAQQWLVVYDNTRCEVERALICQRRDACLRRSRERLRYTARGRT